MAKQRGINPFTGKVGEVVGRKLNGEYIISAPGGFTSEKLQAGKKDQFKAVFENASEFRRASMMASAIYKTIDKDEFSANLHGKAYNYLVGQLQNFLKYDKVHPKGKRKPNETAIMQSVGYQFNPPAQSTLKDNLQITETDQTNLTITIPRGGDQFVWPKPAAAIQLFFNTAQIDYQNQTAPNPAFHFEELRKEEIPPNHQIQIPTPPGNCLLLIGARFLEEVNNDFYLLHNKTHSPLFIGYYRKGD